VAIPTLSVGTGAEASNSGTGLTASHTIPAAVAVGDVMILSLRTAANTGTISTPTGWAIVQGPSRSTSAMSFITFVKTAEAADTGGAATAQSTLQSSVAWRTSFVWLSGANRGASIDTSTANLDNASNTTALVTSLTTTRADDLLVLAGAGSDTTATFTAPTTPAAFAEHVDTGGVTVASLGRASAGAAGVGNATSSASQRTIMHLIAIKPQNALVGTFSDDFDDNSIDAKWTTFVNTNAAIAETGQQLVLTPPTPSGTGSAVVNSDDYFDLTGSELAVELVTAGIAHVNVESWAGVQADASNRYIFLRNNTTLYLRRTLAGVNSDATVTYDATAHRWIMITETGGNVLWRTSPDGSTWTTRRTLAVTPSLASDAQVYLRCLTTATVAAPGTMTLDNLNVSPVVTEAAEGAIVAASTVAGTLSATVPAAGSVASAATVAGTLSATVPAAGSVAAAASVAGTLAATVPLAGAVAAEAAVSGMVGEAVEAAGAVVASSSVAGSLATAVPLGGAVAAAATVAATLAAAVSAAGAVVAASSVAGDAAADAPLAGAVAASSAVEGALTEAVPAAGTVAASSSVAGDALVAAALVGASAAASAAAGSATSLRAASGSVAAASTAEGALAAAAPLAGASAGTAAVAGDLSVAGGLAGAVAAEALVGGAASAAVPVAGAVAGAAVVAGAATVTSESGVAGAVAGSSAVAGALSADAALVGSAVGSSAVVGAGVLALPLAGAAAASSSVEAAAVLILGGSGAVAAASLVAGDLVAAVALVGDVAAASSVGGDATTGVAPVFVGPTLVVVPGTRRGVTTGSTRRTVAITDTRRLVEVP
jgi:hypothetical protein